MRRSAPRRQPQPPARPFPPSPPPQGVAALAAADGVQRLRALQLSDNQLGPRAAQPLAQLLAAGAALASLELRNTGVGDAGGPARPPA
jgi:hypothetical protein